MTRDDWRRVYTIKCVRDSSALYVEWSRVNPIQRHRHERDGALSFIVTERTQNALKAALFRQVANLQTIESMQYSLNLIS